MNFAQRLLQKLIKSDAVTQTVMALYQLSLNLTTLLS